MNMEAKPQLTEAQRRYQLMSVFRGMVTNLSKLKPSALSGSLDLVFPQQKTVFAVYIKRKVLSFEHIVGYIKFDVSDDPSNAKHRAAKIVEALKAEDIERLVEIHGYDHRTRVQRYMDQHGVHA